MPNGHVYPPPNGVLISEFAANQRNCSRLKYSVQSTATPAERRTLNTVVLAAHGLNCHWLGPYGNEWVDTPGFNALACESVVFDRHFATDPSPAGFANALPTEALRALRAAGVFALRVDDRKTLGPDGRDWSESIAVATEGHATPGDALLAAIRQASGRLVGHEPWLLWIETERLVPPWDLEYETYQRYAESTGGFTDDAMPDDELPEPIDSPAIGPFAANDRIAWHQMHNSFAAAVASFDGELIALRKLLADCQATWIVASGYGWPLGEHGVVGPTGSRLHEELVHVPLIVRHPDGRDALRRVQHFTQMPDLAGTLLELFGHPANPSIWTGRTEVRLELGPERALRNEDWAFLPTSPSGPVRLYVKPDDLWEVNDVATSHPDECDALTVELEPNPESSS